MGMAMTKRGSMGATARLLAMLAMGAGLVTGMGSGAAVAQSAEPPKIGLELNKLEANDGACRAYVVLRNESDVTYESFNPELLVFGVDGVIIKRLAVPFPPIQAGRTKANLFDMKDVACDQVGEVLLNGFFDCKADGQALGDCIDRVELSSRAKARFFK